MPKALKTVLWIAVFAVCAGAGAFAAAHTDPFPPGVADPGARLDPTPSSASPAPQELRFDVTMASDTRHELHVGGTCRTRWRTTGRVTVHDHGSVSGEGTAELRGKAGCDFSTAQIQTRTIRLKITGTLDGRVLELRFAEAGRDPKGSQDLGGLTNTLRYIVPALKLVLGKGEGVVMVREPDGDLGRWVSANRATVACATGC